MARMVKNTGTSYTLDFSDTPSKNLYAELENEIRAYFDDPAFLEKILGHFREMLESKVPYEGFRFAASFVGVHGVLVKGLIRMAHNSLKTRNPKNK